MPAGRPPTPALPAEVAGDPELRSKAKNVVMAAYDNLLEMLEEGTPADRFAATRAMIPAVSKMMQEDREDKAITELRERVEQMHAEIREAIGWTPGHAAPEDDDDD